MISGSWTAIRRAPARSVFRYAGGDAVFVGLSIVHAALLVVVPSIALVAIGLWWSANTVAHNFIHRPFFRSHALNRIYSGWLTLVLGVPQEIWRERHLAHHADRPVRMRWTWAVAGEVALVCALWAVLVAVAPRTFAFVYLPGWVIGLVLCQLQGHYEHAGGTTSHYGWLYNWLFFNDGYHVEHHARPGLHWTELPSRTARAARESRWPPVLRWIDACSLQGLERLVLASPALQRFVLDRHERAFRVLLSRIGDPREVLVIGGGMFPRTALLVRRLWPIAHVAVVDADADHLRLATGFLDGQVSLTHRLFTAGETAAADLVVVPLAYLGDRDVFYRRPPARAVLVHDWIWVRRGEGVVISWLLLKRLNLVVADPDGNRA